MKSRLCYALLFATVFALAACGEKSDMDQKIVITADKVEKKTELNAGEVGMPGTGFVLAAASKNAVMVAVDRDQDRHDLSIWFFIKENGKWMRGHDFSYAYEPPRSADELLRNAYGDFGCKGGVPVCG